MLGTRSIVKVLTGALVTVSLPGRAAAEIAAIWALDDGTKIKATDTNHPLERGNGVYDAARRQVSLFGARNEVVAFQVILEGGARQTEDVQVALDRLGPIHNCGLSTDPDAYFLGRRIELFAEHYLNVTTRSHDLAWQSGSAAEPAGMTGWIPDALIPIQRDVRLVVPANQNQGVWVDIYIPKETPPGTYRGSFSVQAKGVPCPLRTCWLPVELQVLDAVLPDTPTAKTMLWFSGGEGDDRKMMYARYSPTYETDDFETVERLRMRHFKLGRRHRVTMFLGDQAVLDASVQARLDGTAFSRERGYDGPGEGIGQDMYSIHTWGGELTPTEAQVWHSSLAPYGPNLEYFLYTMDEPGSADVEAINQIAANAQPVPSFVTAAPSPDLQVDIFCTFPSIYSLAMAAQARQQGKRVWIYNGMRPHTGTFVIDDAAVSPRANPWIQYKYHIPRWFYWESTYYRDFQGKRGQINVFQEPINFSNRFGDQMNGDGLLIYPGRDIIFPEEDRHFEGPMPSIRLKNWRRGIQDVEYLVLAAAAGHEDLVKEVVETLVPRALDDGGLTSSDPVSFPEDGEIWLAQRRRLAELLERLPCRGRQPPFRGEPGNPRWRGCSHHQSP